MANELTVGVYMRFNDGVSQSQSMRPADISVDVTGDKYIRQMQEIGTSAENLGQGDIGTPGYMICHNTDDTNFVEIGYDDTGFKNVVKLKAGEWALFRHSQATPQAKADTAAVDLEYWLIED